MPPRNAYQGTGQLFGTKSVDQGQGSIHGAMQVIDEERAYIKERCYVISGSSMRQPRIKGQGQNAEKKGQVSCFANQLAARVQAYWLTREPTQLTGP